ncbi:MAG: hypothetical protein K2M44_01055 [Clostridia bacterium]|nr:hypothetical protein [Clostridia bacterium]
MTAIEIAVIVIAVVFVLAVATVCIYRKIKGKGGCSSCSGCSSCCGCNHCADRDKAAKDGMDINADVTDKHTDSVNIE